MSNFKCQISNCQHWSEVKNHFHLSNVQCPMPIGHSQNNQRGFTLVEFLMYMGILSFILVILTGLFGSILDAGASSHSTSSVEQDAQYLLNKLNYDISHSSSLISPALGSTSATLQLVLNTGSTTYNLDNQGDFLVTANTVSNALTSYDASMSSLLFTRMGNKNGKNSIRVSFTLTSRIRSDTGYQTQTYQTTFGTR